MSRLPRRPLRVKPPLRGRAATKHYRGEFAPVASVRRPLRPYGSAPYPQTRIPLTPPCDKKKPSEDKNSLYAELVELYKSWGRFFQSLGKPWNWLLVLAIVLSSLLLLNRFL